MSSLNMNPRFYDERVEALVREVYPKGVSHHEIRDSKTVVIKHPDRTEGVVLTVEMKENKIRELLEQHFAGQRVRTTLEAPITMD